MSVIVIYKDKVTSKFKDFSKHFVCKDCNSSGGGILIYFKDDIIVDRITDLENETDETVWVKVHTKGQNFLLCCTYRPEWTDTEYWTRLSHAIGMAYQITENIVILGDLNSDLFNTNNNKLLDVINMFNF